MSIVKNIKDFIGNFFLKEKVNNSPREKKPNKFNFNKITTIGILFDATNREDLDLVKHYVSNLTDYSKRVKAVGFFTEKEIPLLNYSKSEYDFFSLKELNWFGKPLSQLTENFINEEYDLLIDLNIHDHFSLKYISTLSKASFKVGKFNENDTAIYDMMIDSDNTKKLKYFLGQIDTYLKMLNKKEYSMN